MNNFKTSTCTPHFVQQMVPLDNTSHPSFHHISFFLILSDLLRPTSSIFQDQLNVYHRLYWYRLSVLISHFWENSVSIGPARRNMNRLSSRGRVGAVNHKSFASAHSAPWLHNGLYQVKNCSSCQHRWKQMVFFFFSFISRELIFYSNPCLNRFRTRLFWPWSRGWVLAYCCLRLTLYFPPLFCVTYIFLVPSENDGIITSFQPHLLPATLANR